MVAVFAVVRGSGWCWNQLSVTSEMSVKNSAQLSALIKFCRCNISAIKKRVISELTVKILTNSQLSMDHRNG